MAIIFYKREGAEELEEWMGLNLKDGDIVFEIDRHFSKGNRKTYEDYLREQDLYEIDEAALKVSENWYINDSGEDISRYEGVSLGKMVEYKLMKYFVALFKDIAVLMKIREKDAPQTFVFVDDGSTLSRLLKLFSDRFGIKIEPLSRKTVIPERHLDVSFRKNIRNFLWRFLVFFAKFRLKKAVFKKIVAIEAYGKFIPLVRKLAEEGHKVIVLGRLGSGKGLFHPNIFYYPLAGLERRAKGGRSGCGDLPLLGTTFRSFDAGEIMAKRLERIICDDFPFIRGSISKIKNFLEKQKIDAVITLQDRDGINRILVSSANSLGLNTIEIQHGTLSDIPSLVSAVSGKICVWGDASKEFYIKRGIDEKKVFVTGDPVLERLRRASPLKISRLKKALNLTPGRPVVIFASQPFIEITSLDSPLKTLDLFELICRAAQELKEIEFLIKFHPSENAEIKREILKKYRCNNLAAAGRGLTGELLSLSNLLITFCSSMVIEACLLGIPIIAVNLTGKKDFLPLAAMGAALGVYQERDLVPSIKCALNDEETKNKLKEGQKRFISFCVSFDRPAIERILRII